MYVFVRKDLTHSQQVVQASHACIEASRFFLKPDIEHPHLVVIGVKNQNKLKKCIEHLQQLNIYYKEFIEPDIGNEVTAVATIPISGEIRTHLAKYCLLS
jgi:hypothetical protein